ncbi:glycosyltransferase family 4 protein, partial [Candidatus Woesearchaeota archaeon]|nr:glycosyltransferase family 4 protein [Candidatus Woesearchaeota archaeon]
FKHADTILVLNDSAKRNIVKHLGIPESKIVLMPNGVNNKVYTPIKDRGFIKGLKKKHNLGNDKVLFHVGSVCPRKNQLGIIKSLKDIMKERNIRLLYAGGIIDNEYFQEIQAYVKNEGIERNVIYLGEVKPGKDLNEYYNLADAFIFHSTSEAFGLVPLEALSAGNPVFMSENLKNYFYPKSSTDGFIYFNEKNAKQIIKKYFFDDKFIKRASKEALEYIRKNFSWDAVAEKHLALFEKIIEKENQKE